jgi:hypothetical protein
MIDDRDLRDHLLFLLLGKGAHVDFDTAVADLPAELRGVRPNELPYSPWMIVEHMRIAQWDILEFCTNSKHISPIFPDGYWPTCEGPPTDTAWDETVAAFRKDLKSMRNLVEAPHTNLFAVIPHGDGQTILREALLVADHNAYHLGQLVVVRRLLGAWKD